MLQSFILNALLLAFFIPSGVIIRPKSILHFLFKNFQSGFEFFSKYNILSFSIISHNFFLTSSSLVILANTLVSLFFIANDNVSSISTLFLSFIRIFDN